MIYDREELEERYGFTRFRCPKCKRTSYADGAAECSHCGWSEADEEEFKCFQCGKKLTELQCESGNVCTGCGNPLCDEHGDLCSTCIDAKENEEEEETAE